MMKVKINNLVVEGCHGVYTEEKVTPQSFRIDVEMIMSSERAGVSDDLNDTVNWALIKNDIATFVKENSFSLVEKLAVEIAQMLKRYHGVEKVRVEVGKLDAFKEGEGYPSVEIEV